MSQKQETRFRVVENSPEKEKKEETQTLERCRYCGRLKTSKHETYHYDKKSAYKQDVIICIDYLEDGTKIHWEKQLSDPEWKQPLVPAHAFL